MLGKNPRKVPGTIFYIHKLNTLRHLCHFHSCQGEPAHTKRPVAELNFAAFLSVVCHVQFLVNCAQEPRNPPPTVATSGKQRKGRELFCIGCFSSMMLHILELHSGVYSHTPAQAHTHSHFHTIPLPCLAQHLPPLIYSLTCSPQNMWTPGGSEMYVLFTTEFLMPKNAWDTVNAQEILID